MRPLRAPMGRLAPALGLAALCAPYLYRLEDVPLVKVDEFWGGQPSWEIWSRGRFALPALAGYAGQEERTSFHPPGFYLVNALVVGPLRPLPWSVRLLPTLAAIASFLLLHRALHRTLLRASGGLRAAGGGPGARPAALAGAALAGTALAALNPLTFALARHARPETWILLLATASAALLLPVRSAEQDPPFSSRCAGSSRGAGLRALAAGLLSGYAVFSHYWAACVPCLAALFLILERRWRSLAWYAAGVAVFTGVTAAWVLEGWSRFEAETRWLRGDLLGGSLLEYLRRRLVDQASLALDPRTLPVWLVEAFALALLFFRAAAPLRRRTLALLGLLHLLLFLFPRQSPYYPISVLYASAAASALALGRLAEPPPPGSPPPSFPARWLPAAALALVLAVTAGGLGWLIVRDHGASYRGTFRPFREAVERADPEGKGAVLGSEIHYLTFWDRPFLLRWNPCLWEAGGDPSPEALIGHWRRQGIRFVLLSSLMPAEARLGPLDPSLDRAVVERLRASSTLLAREETRYYAEPEHKYRQAAIELLEIGQGEQPHGPDRSGQAPAPAAEGRGRF